jgi:capsular exopolysaccharide synthesis family protein
VLAGLCFWLPRGTTKALANDHTETSGWLVPEGEQQGLTRYVETLRERWKLIVLAIAVTVLAAALYVASANKSYDASAKLLVTPISRDNEALAGLGLIPDSPDPTRDVETAAQLITTTSVAQIARADLHTNRSPRSLLDDVTAAPVAQSNLVVVKASAPEAREAQRLANAFARATVEDRTGKLHRQLDVVLGGLRAALSRSGSGRTAIARRIALLETLRASDDPTIHVDTLADTPGSAAWPRPKLSIFAALVAGLVLGIGAAFMAQLLDPRLRRESQLRAIFRLPILARIPVEKAGAAGAIPPRQLSPEGVEAFRALRATLEAAASGRAIVITGSWPGEGTSTTALNLATSLALAGKRVILIEADLRRPAIGAALGVEAGRGIRSVLLGEAAVGEALVTTDAPGATLKLLLADHSAAWMADQLSLAAARALIDEAKQIADYVIVDAPPLTAVVDALPLVQMADDVLVVARLGKTNVGRLGRLGELLSQHRVTPLGIALVGVPRDRDHGYYGELRWGRASGAPQAAAEREPVLPAS